jgi:hypothetical protein
MTKYPSNDDRAAADPRTGLREFIYENAGNALIEAEIVQCQAELDDLPGLTYAVRKLVAYTRAIAQTCNDLNAATAGPRREAAK